MNIPMFANSKVVAQVTVKIARRFKHDSNTVRAPSTVVPLIFVSQEVTLILVY